MIYADSTTTRPNVYDNIDDWTKVNSSAMMPKMKFPSSVLSPKVTQYIASQLGAIPGMQKYVSGSVPGIQYQVPDHQQLVNAQAPEGSTEVGHLKSAADVGNETGLLSDFGKMFYGKTDAEGHKIGAGAMDYLNGAGSIWDMYNAYKAQKMGEEAFKHNIASDNTNLYNQAVLTNQDLTRRAIIGNQLNGMSRDASLNAVKSDIWKQNHLVRSNLKNKKERAGGNK